MSGLKKTFAGLAGLIAGPIMGSMSKVPSGAYKNVVNTYLRDKDKQGNYLSGNAKNGRFAIEPNRVAAEKMRVAFDLLTKPGAVAIERVIGIGREGVALAQSGKFNAKDPTYGRDYAKYSKGILDAIAKAQGQQAPAPAAAPAAPAQTRAPTTSAPTPTTPRPAQTPAPTAAPKPTPKPTTTPAPTTTPKPAAAPAPAPGYTGPTRMIGTVGTLGSRAQGGAMVPGNKGVGKKRRGRMDTLLSGLGGAAEQFGG